MDAPQAPQALRSRFQHWMDAFLGVDDGIAEAITRAIGELGDGFVLAEGDRFVYVNEAFCRMTGYTRNELTSPEFRPEILWAPHERERMAARARMRQSGEWPEEHYEVTIQPLRGPLVSVEVSVKPLRASGRDLRCAIVRDVTGRRRAQEDLDRAKRELATSEKLAALGSLVSGVAHEVRTPLAYIQNNLFLLRGRVDRARRHEAPPDELLAEMDDLLRMAEEGVDRVHHLVRDLGRYTRLPSEPTVARLDEIVREALHLFRATHPALHVTVREDLEPTPALVVDRAKIQQVVLNLVGNANDVVGPGGEIVVSTKAVPEGACLVVRDNGPGIPPAMVGRIFEPLYTTKGEGMGLGLSIVRRIVELHKGSIRVESAPGKGTAFEVRLPVAAP